MCCGIKVKIDIMEKYELIKEYFYKYEKYGIQKCDNGATLVGHPDYLLPNWWLVEFYTTLSTSDIECLEEQLGQKLPEEYAEFVSHVSNGLIWQWGTFSIYGLRKSYARGVDASRLPFSILTPNVDELCLIKNAKNSCFFIGGYNFDGSKLYIDKMTNKVHYCARYDATPLYTWNSMEEMLISEMTRLHSLYTENGRLLGESEKVTLPNY